MTFEPKLFMLYYTEGDGYALRSPVYIFPDALLKSRRKVSEYNIIIVGELVNVTFPVPLILCALFSIFINTMLYCVANNNYA